MKDLLKNYHRFSKEKQKLFKVMLEEKGIEITDYVILPQQRDGKPFPASFAQKRLWFLEQFEPGSPLYVIPVAVKVKGELNKNVLRDSINEIVKRHEVLRTSFKSTDGNVFQVIHPELKIDIKEIDLSKEENKNEKLNEILEVENTKPFDLTVLPLFRVTLVSLSDKEKVLIIPMHHIISDNWSTAIFVKELLTIYKNKLNGKENGLEDLPVQYADFSVWQLERIKKKLYKEQTGYWINKLSGSNDTLDIITDYKHPAAQTFNGSFELFEIPENILGRLKQIAKETDTTLFMILISAFQIMLYKFTNQNDINIGTPIANRNRAEIEGLIGFFINTLVMRADLSGNPIFKELLQRTKTTAYEAYQNQDVPFEEIVDKLKLERDLSKTALFQVMFVLNNARMEKLELPGMQFEVLDVDTKTTKFDLVLSITEADNQLKGKFEYNTDLYKSFTIKQMIKAFVKILNDVSVNPALHIDDLILSDKPELSILEGESYETIGNIDVYELIEKTANLYSENIALSGKTREIKYSELLDIVDNLANHFINSGVRNNDIVAVYLNRSLEYIISMLAILKTGATYLPLDIDYPEERLEYLLNDSSAKFVITKDDYSNKLEKYNIEILNIEQTGENVLRTDKIQKPDSEDTAYIIYTSGSTGKPKGVEVSHKALVNHLLIMQKHFNVNGNDKELLFAAFNFDASIEQALVPLISGAELFIREDEIWTPKEFTQIINEQNLSIINPPTVVWNELTKYWNENPDEAPVNKLKLCIAGGDVMKPDILHLWNDSPMSNIRLLNAYGPTEGIITVSTSEANKIKTEKLFRTPIGKPLPGRTFYVVDKNLKILPKGFAGELLISSEIIAKGYLNRPETTEEKFIKNLFNENTITYRTGDLVRVNENDEIEFIGRIDTQVKIRGFRIELGEIESVIRNSEFVKDVVVTANNDNGNKYLAAYIMPDDSKDFDEQALRKYLKNKLPDYMIPAVFSVLEKFPLTPSGKIDIKSLPEVKGTEIKRVTEYVDPRSDMEKEIAEIIRNVLHIEKVGVFDNFFELGGHSMLAMQVISKINENFNVEISIKSLFENPTIDGISTAILEAQMLEQDEDELERLLKEISGSEEESGKTLLADENNDNNPEQTV